MRCERAADAAAARALAPPPADVEAGVREILAAVRERGDAALDELTRRHDTGGAPVVQPGEADLDAALAALAPEVRAALELAQANVTLVAEAALTPDREVTLPQSHTVLLRDVPVGAAGIYAPGGRNPYPSSVVMGAATARAAGVADVALVAPPGPDGRVHPTILAAARLAGATRVHAAGGAQAVAALAYGTETIGRVDVVAGPGNAWVTEAKRQLAGVVGIDGLAGPSDVVVVAGADARRRDVVFDLLAQAEHGPGTLAVLATPDRELLHDVQRRLGEVEDTGAVAVLHQAADLEAALAFAEAFAPEHLELLGPAAEALAPRVTRAGCVFVGTGTAFGDYVAGSNHVLPTGGAARFSSGLSPRAFRRRFSEVRVPDAAAARLAPAGSAIARAEGFTGHAASMDERMDAR